MVAGIPFVDTSTGAFKYQGTSGTPAVIAGADGSVHLVPMIHPFTGSTGFQSTSSSGFTGVGVISFDPSALFNTNTKIVRSIKFEAILESSSGVTSEIQLYNLSVGSIVTGSVLSSSSNSPAVVSATLTVAAAPNVPNSQQIYEIQLRISSPGSPTASNRAICKSAQIVVTWT